MLVFSKVGQKVVLCVFFFDRRAAFWFWVADENCPGGCEAAAAKAGRVGSLQTSQRKGTSRRSPTGLRTGFALARNKGLRKPLSAPFQKHFRILNRDHVSSGSESTKGIPLFLIAFGTAAVVCKSSERCFEQRQKPLRVSPTLRSAPTAGIHGDEIAPSLTCGRTEALLSFQGAEKSERAWTTSQRPCGGWWCWGRVL